MKLLRRIGIVFLTVLLLLVVGLVTLFLVTDPKDLLKLLSDQLETKTGRTLSAKEVRFNPLKGIELKKVKLSNLGGLSKGAALEFDNVSFVYQPLSLFLGHFDILDIQISDFYTTSAQIKTLIRDFSVKKSSQQKKKNLLRITIRQIEILNSQILYKDIPINLKLRIQPSKDINQTRIRLNASSLYGSIHFEGTPQSGELYAQKIRLKKLIPRSPDILLTEIHALIQKQDNSTYEATGKTAVVEWNGLLFRSTSQFKVSYGLKSKSILLHNLDLNVNQNRLTLERLYYAIPSRSLELQIPKSSINLSDFVENLKGDLSGSLSLSYHKKLHLQGDLSVSNLSWASITNGEVALLALDPLIQGNLHLFTLGGELSAEFDSSDLSSQALNIHLNSKKLILSKLIASVKQSGEKKAFRIHIPLRILFSTHIDTLLFGKTRLNSFDLFGKAYQDVIEVPTLRFHWIRGQADANLTIQNNIARGEICFENGKLKDLTADYLPPPRKLYGTLNMTGKFYIPITELQKSLFAITLNVQNGELKQLILQDKLSRALYNIPLNDVFFREIQTKLTLNNGQALIQNLRFESDSIQMTGGANLNLNWFKENPIQWKKVLSDSIFDSLHAEFSIKKDFVSGLPNFTQLFTSEFSDGDSLRIKIKGKGPLTKPTIQIVKP